MNGTEGHPGRKKASSVKWQPQETKMLISLINQQLKESPKIAWAQVTQQMPNRTLQQCKSYYFSQLRNHKLYHKWTQEEAARLYYLMTYYKSDIKYVQRKYYPTLSAQQIMHKYRQVHKRRERELQQLQEIERNSIPYMQKMDLEHLYNLVQVWLYRIQLIELQKRGTPYQLPPRPQISKLDFQLSQDATSASVSLAEEHYLAGLQKRVNLRLCKDRLGKVLEREDPL